ILERRARRGCQLVDAVVGEIRGRASVVTDRGESLQTVVAESRCIVVGFCYLAQKAIDSIARDPARWVGSGLQFSTRVSKGDRLPRDIADARQECVGPRECQ